MPSTVQRAWAKALVFPLSLTLSQCARFELKQDRESLTQALQRFCSIGTSNKETKGSAWMKLQSRNESVQFPTTIHAWRQNHLDLEATNLIGTRLARLQIQGEHFVFEQFDHSRRVEGEKNWKGIPVHWVTGLFFGRFPCPPFDRPFMIARGSEESSMVITATSGDSPQRFIYHLRQWGTQAWPVSLLWESNSTRLDFDFDQPDDQTGSPLKWSARSSFGEIKLSWKEFEKI